MSNKATIRYVIEVPCNNWSEGVAYLRGKGWTQQETTLDLARLYTEAHYAEMSAKRSHFNTWRVVPVSVTLMNTP